MDRKLGNKLEEEFDSNSYEKLEQCKVSSKTFRDRHGVVRE
jgi:hypothetical protein